MIFTSNRVNDFKVPLGLQKHDKLCVVMDFFFFPTFFIGLPKENLITFGSLPILTSDGSGPRSLFFGRPGAQHLKIVQGSPDLDFWGRNGKSEHFI